MRPFCLHAGWWKPGHFLPKRTFPVQATLADMSERQDRSHVREAYASITFGAGQAVNRLPLALLRNGQAAPVLKADEFLGFAVDAGTDKKTWLAELFENESDDCWFARMDDPNHIRAGIASIKLPLGHNGENLILFHSGWGDGHYPVVGSF